RSLPPPPTGGNVPEWMHRILARGLSELSEDRFPSMVDLLTALDDDPARRHRKRRRTMAIAALAVAMTGLGVALAATRGTQECAPDPADLKGIWDDAARADVSASFDRSGATGAHEIAGRVIKVLDETAARWTLKKADSCE